MCVYDDGSGPALYVAGSFVTAGGIECNGVARWDGSDWDPLADTYKSGVKGLQDAAYSLAVFDDGGGEALYVGGQFVTAGDAKVYGVAKWDGHRWSALAGPVNTGVDSVMHALKVFDDGGSPALYAAGNFYRAGGIMTPFIARWDGKEWSRVADADGFQVNGTAYALEVFDDGSGPALFVGGTFGSAGGEIVSRIAKWDGAKWHGLQGRDAVGVHGSHVNALTAIQNERESSLYVGGSFWSAGGEPSVYFAKWIGCTGTCTGDVNGDGVIDLADLNIVLANFGQAVPFGDADGSGSVDMTDLNIVISAFGNTCDG